MYSNIFYFKKIWPIGGTEQFLYEIAKKYKDYDITVVYDTIDPYQLERLKKLVRCKKHRKGEIIRCNKAFFNFNTEIIDEVEANQYYFIAHAVYQELGYKEPPVANKKLTDFLGVSDYASNKLKDFGKKLGRDIDVVTCYNPLTLEPKEKVLHIVGASRLDDTTKGGKRMLKLIEAMDRYCEKTGRHYLFTIFTNTNLHINSKNVAIMPPRVDVRPYIQDADYVVQLSNDMETYCYTTNEAWGYGVPVVRTALTVCNELPLTDDMSLICDWDMSNVDEVVKEMFERTPKPFTYTPPADNWLNIIDTTKSTYEEELKMRYKVEALDTYETYNVTDKDLHRVPKAGETFDVSKERLDVLLGDNEKHRVYVKVVEEIKDEVTEEVVQAVANAIVDEAEEQNKTVETIVEEIVEESKPKKKTTKKGGK